MAWQRRECDGILSTLNAVIEALTIPEDGRGIPPAGVTLGSAKALLTTIRVDFPHSTLMTRKN